ncbi:MAG TPA: HemK2/MTQ2 family protein methyltransferase [Mycobacterium sp.]
MALPGLCETIVADTGVYQPQEDSWLLIETLQRTGLAHRRRVLDLCTGSGILAVAAAQLGASEVTAFDICPHAVRCSQANASAIGVDVDVRKGTLSNALACGPFDVVLSNPPYVPVAPHSDAESISTAAGPAWAWDAGDDGRLVLDPLCAAAPKLLADGGTMLVVQSEFAGVEQTMEALRAGGLDTEVALWQWIPFGPVLSARAKWLEATGRLAAGRRDELLAVIRADKR